jgi:predicted permease
MLLPLFIFVIGMLYYRLAKKHHKPAWGYAFLGIGVFVGTPVIVGLILWLIVTAFGASRDIEFTIALWAILACATATIVLYQMLKRAWAKKTHRKIDNDLLDQ